MPMKIETELNAMDVILRAEAIDGFVPEEVFDFHAHVMEPASYAPTTLGPHLNGMTVSPTSYRHAMSLLLPGERLTETLVFPFPAREHDRPAINRWMFEQIDLLSGSFKARGLAIVSPHDDPTVVAAEMATGRCAGLKPYHFYAWKGDTSQVGLEDFAPEWMWKLCDRHGAVLMLHLMRDDAVAEPGNSEALVRLSKKYPGCQAVLAHVARSFNHRTSRGLRALKDLPNIWVDMSAITEAESIRAAIEILGPHRVLYGSDYPISHLRGRCVTVGDQFLWLYTEEAKAPKMTLVGIESLRALRDACTQAGLGPKEVQGIFRDNGRAVLKCFHR